MTWKAARTTAAQIGASALVVIAAFLVVYLPDLRFRANSVGPIPQGRLPRAEWMRWESATP